MNIARGNKPGYLLFTFILIFLGCDHVNSLIGAHLDTDRAVDELMVSEQCTEADLSFLFPRAGIVAIDGTDANRIFAVSTSGTLYDCVDRNCSISTWGLVFDSFPSFWGMTVAEGGEEIIFTGASHSQPEIGASWEYRHLHEGGGGGGIGWLPESLSHNASPGRRVSAWFSDVIAQSYRDYVLVGGFVKGQENASIPDFERDLISAIKKAQTSGSMLLRCNDLECKEYKSPPSVPLTAAQGFSTGDFYAVGNRIDHQETCHEVVGEIYHCNKVTCILEATVDGSFLTEIHLNRDGEIFVVGGVPATQEQNGKSVLLQRKDGKWTELTTGFDVPLRDVWGSTDNLYVVGGHRDEDGNATTLAMKRGGDGWQQLDVGLDMPLAIGENGPLYAVWGSSAGDVLIGGESGLFDLSTNAIALEEGSDVDSMCHDYCAMETNCISECLCTDETNCHCSTPGHRASCLDECGEWLSSYDSDPNCSPDFRAWIYCITHTTCEGVKTFFSGHPDGLVETDTCAPEYFAMDCRDFEPRTEYSF